MKRIFLSFGLLAGLSFAAQAQATIGLKGGVSLTNVVGSDVEESDLKVGFLAGGVLNFGLSDIVSLQPEVFFSRKGDKSEFDTGSGNVTLSAHLDYVDVPVLLKVSTEPKGNGLFFVLGPQLGILVSSKITDGDESMTIENLRTVDFGYVAGLGYQLPTGLNFDLRYNGGISNVYEEISFLGNNFQPKVRNSAFQLSVGYMFNKQ